MLHLLIRGLCIALAIAVWLLSLAASAAFAQTIVDPFVDLVPPKKIGPFDGSYAQCILDKMPGVASDVAANAIAQVCLHDYPEGFRTAESGSSLLGFDSGAACVAKKAHDTSSRQGAGIIYLACHHRYGQTK